MRANIVTAIQAWAKRQPDQVVFQTAAKSMTRAELDRRSAHVARYLSDNEIRPGEPVGVLGGMSLEWCVAAVGVLRAGAILTPLNNRFPAKELAATVRTTGLRAMLADPPSRDTAEKASKNFGVVVHDMISLCGPATTAVVPPVVDVDDEAVAVLFFTNGSTGVPKAAVFTHSRLLMALFEHTLLEPGYRPGFRMMNVAEFGFTGGVLHGMIAPLLLGGSCYLLEKWNPAEALQVIESERIELMASPTIFYEQMAADPSFGERDLTSLVTPITGAAPVTRTLLEAWHQHGVTLRQHYGQTESGSTITAPTLEVAMQHPDSAGYGGILAELRVVREDGSDCDPNEDGEILIRTPAQADGYWRAAELSAKVFRDGWIHSGDVGAFDEEGLLRIRGRVKDMIISGGMNIYAAEIERAIGELDGVAEVGVIGVPDPKWGETPAAIVRLDRPVAIEEILAHCREELASYKLPHYIEFAEEPLPRSMGNKLLKECLRERYGDLHERRAPDVP